MAVLIIKEGPEAGKQFPLEQDCIMVGRQPDAPVFLPPKAVSRQHAHILRQEKNYFIEDLNSSNGTFLNGQRIRPHESIPIHEKDALQIGPYVLELRQDLAESTPTDSLVIRDEISVVGFDSSVYSRDASQKLQVVLDIAQHLSRTLDLDSLLQKLFTQLMRLFPQADRCLALLYQGDKLIVRGQHCRYEQDASNYPYSRTVVNRTLEEGVGILSEDAQQDQRFDSSATLTSMNLHSLLCVPLICPDGRRLGVIQVDRFRAGKPFRSEDLQLLTTICLQLTVVLDNADLHEQLLKEERLRQELMLARDIQQGFLPSNFAEFKQDGFELYACVHPARQVSGDLYDFCRLPDGRLSFFVGDVSGKGMPAALFMVAVRTLSRHLAAAAESPSKTLLKLNESLCQDNPEGLFVTLCHGIFDPKTGEVILVSGGHHLPLLSHPDGKVEEIQHRSGKMLGYGGLDLRLTDTRFELQPGDILVFYTDGVTEAKRPKTKEMFGLPRLMETVAEFNKSPSLPECADLVKSAVHQFTGQDELQDDVTLFLLQRK